MSVQNAQRTLPLPENSVLVICDIQKRFRKYFRNIETLIANTKFVVHCCEILDIPILITEQVTKVFGSTVDELQSKKATFIEKSSFSVCCPAILQSLKDLNARNISIGKKDIQNVILTGLEAHVCIFQSCIDLINNGYNVHYLTDCIGSQRIIDQEIALKRLQTSGALLTTSESLVFQLIRDAKHPMFRALQKHIKQHISDLNTLKFQSKL